MENEKKGDNATVRDKDSKQELKDKKKIKKYLRSRGLAMRDTIGSGSYSEVYKACHIKNSTIFAVKVINTNLSENYTVNHLPMEIKVMKEMKHPNIIKVYELARIEIHLIAVVMEFAKNGSIADNIAKNGQYPENVAKIIFKQMLEGLNFMHQKNIAHRDLKVENILLSRCNVAKISDFSFSTVIDPQNPLSTIYCGSLPFFSPQILKNTPYNPIYSDVWSMGVCLYVMLNNTIPFSIKNESEMLKAQLEKNWKFSKRVPNLSSEVYCFISKMLEPDVDKRPSINELLQDVWFQS